MRLVEKHVIRPGHSFFEEVDGLAFLAKNLFNCTTYVIRQHFFSTGKYLNYNEVQKSLKSHPDFKKLPAKVSQHVIKGSDQNWKSWFSALKTFKKNPSDFTGRPRIPGYKHKTEGRSVVTYTDQALSKPELRKGFIKLSQTSIRFPTKVKDKINQVRIVPKVGYYVIEVVYTKEVQEHNLNKGNIASIDVGLNNLGAVTFNQVGLRPRLINGRPLKAINQFFNKVKSKFQSLLPKDSFSSKRLQQLARKRLFKITDYMHNASRRLINMLVQNDIGTLVIGKNDGWKQDINLGSKNNQTFVNVPHANFIHMLTYKAELEGIEVVLQEESYTSKASFLDLDHIPTYAKGEKGNHTFSGRRVSRGLYKSKDGHVINADVNGSFNIMRKAFPNLFKDGTEGVVVHPLLMSIEDTKSA